MSPNFLEIVARSKLGQPPEWRAFHFMRLDECKTETPDFLVKGGVPRLKRSGPKKGEQTWDGVDVTQCAVTTAEIEAAKIQYQQTTGNCWCCQGLGQVFQSWHHIEGTKYKTCPRCRGTGKSIKEQP